ncbi:MAG: stage II sporulation protein M [Saprospiraceae bacterium]|nr:stage II sporulation protein M [Saprospiraceae bacterium]
MREVAFIKRNKDKWLTFERAILGKIKKNPDDLAGLYIQLVNDLSFARTYYPKSKTVVYLNHLASIAFQQIYKTKRAESNQLVYFFKEEIPFIIRQNKRYLIYAFLLFFIAVSMGVLSAVYDESFVRLILGDEYVEMTLNNIKSGDPVAVYKSGSNWGSFIAITMNNLQVGLKCFLYGIAGGLGTVYIVMQNGIMIGAFQTFFHQEGVLWESVRGIWIHGAMEIFAVVIETMAGLILGAGILFPDTFSRLDSFKRSMKTGLKLWLSTLPFTISAGFLEGFITRYSDVMPDFLSVVMIMVTLGFISWYYLIYPFRQKDFETSLVP